MDNRYDAIVVGGGHAGCEAASALARMGCRTLLLTMNLDTIGALSCNPAIGGVAKGHLVREIDAMGGIMGRIADRAAIHHRRLNASKGPAVRATRQQSDMRIYRQQMQIEIMNTPGLDLKQGTVERLLIDDSDGQRRVAGVVDHLGISWRAPAVVLTTGTFLRGLCHVGMTNFQAGRAGDMASMSLAEQLMALELETGRLKTGTTPRLDGRTIDWESLETQPSDDVPSRFSHYTTEPLLPQRHCYITHTNERTHEIIRADFGRSPIFTGVIEGLGPRYCPSVEDKIARFPERGSHQIFLEPQGLDTHEIYPNGISTSLPYDTQIQIVRSIPGLERAEIMRPGYAVEYDFVNPQQLRPNLELFALPGLWLAGQINGTSGYEEAAAQGLMAGINVARKLNDEAPFVLGRDEAYIGVLLDDLTTHGATEPYRMFTSRAEYRLLLREDNADRRLSARGREVGLVDDEAWQIFQDRQAQFDEALSVLNDTIFGTSAEAKSQIAAAGLGGIEKATSLSALLRRSGATFEQITSLVPDSILPKLSEEVAIAVEIEARYAGYLARQAEQAAAVKASDDQPIPEGLNFADVHGLSEEIKEKLQKVRPASLGQARRINGVTSSAITSLWLWLRKLENGRSSVRSVAAPHVTEQSVPPRSAESGVAEARPSAPQA